MERAARGKRSFEAAALSDEDLIRRYCADPPDRPAGEELFGRCIPRLRTTIRKMVFAKSSICPPWHSKDAFLSDAESVAAERLFRGIDKFDFKGSFDGWLARIASTAALDVHRKLKGRGKEPNPTPETLETLDGEERALPADFRSRYWGDPESYVWDREMRDLASTLLTLHLWDSLDRRESPDAIAWYWLEDRPVKDIAETLACSERSVWRLFRHDYDELKKTLTARTGATKFSDLEGGV